MRKALIAFTTALALLLAGCGGSPQPSPSPEPTPTPSQTQPQKQFALPYQPGASLHPITSNNRANLVLACLVYQGLFELDNTFTPHAVLCSQYSTPDAGTTWNFTVSSAVFSDGSPVTADDVAASLELARRSEIYAGRLADVRRISVSSDSTVTVTLTRPNTNLPALLDIPIVRAGSDGSMPLGTGAYTFVEDNGPLRLLLRSADYPNAPKEISLFPIGAADDLIYAFDSGEVSLVLSDLTGANALGYSSGYESFDHPTTTMLYVGFNTVRGFCRESLVRQAVSLSFDRNTVTTSLLAGHADATCLPLSPRSFLHSESHEKAGAYNPTAAAQLLTNAGFVKGGNDLLYRRGAPLSLVFIVNTDNPFKLSIAEYLVKEMTSLGISVQLKKLPWDDYVAALSRGSFDLYLGEVSLTADFDLNALLGQKGSLNYGGYRSTEFQYLHEQLRRADEGSRNQAAEDLLTRFQTDAPLAPLCFKSHSVLTQWKAVSGLNPTRQNPFYQLESLRFDA